METLSKMPYLALKEIVQQLRPADLARCSAVCRDWRETFNQDWIWKPHCDPELEEPLRTIPSVAPPAFVTPEVKDSTLSPICRWRLIFMRENHLWNNLRDKMLQENEISEDIENYKKDIVCVSFLVDNMLVVWRYHKIEILDVSRLYTFVCKAKTDASFIPIDDQDKCRVMGATMLLVETEYTVEVYNIDMTNQLISLNNCIDLAEHGFVPYEQRFAKNHLYFVADDQRKVIKVIDLNTGEIIKDTPYPVVTNTVVWIKSSLTSDFIAVRFEHIQIKPKDYARSIFIYSIEHFTFVPNLWIHDFFALYRHWVAYLDSGSLKVYNLHAGDFQLELGNDTVSELHVWNNCFVFKETKYKAPMKKVFLRKYSPEQRTLTTITECVHPNVVYIDRIINQKYPIVHQYENHVQMIYLWKLSGEAIEKIVLDDSVNEAVGLRLLGFNPETEVNKSFTRAIFNDFKSNYYVQYLW